MKKILILIGLLQALGVFVYCFLVALVMFVLLPKILTTLNVSQIPQFLPFTLMLSFLVLSAGITGSLVFGYPVYLGHKQKIREALTVLGFTFLFLILIFAITIGLLLAFA
ncbi:hypothetical protein CO172_00115 [Candidatus Uhrbacteria bacterium CG_4_9_14_3_um_filter_36_7]|uniref:Major facilitator superfamily (MFS) profile domain-containing protein n=1 Tax=Candidatus Uhrbacteria bacterium CG_4_9_14_3_um_filter_36_7 TaxID=1975033 RepID=A0A2M7XIK4_9BACT|nr:MAG: hypothetical protein CO172_00115 [Candidatus Uhrbacteria bacterium CG_4_9_14_3_um_filter_36_7]